MTVTTSLNCTGARSGEPLFHLQLSAKSKVSWTAFDSSTGFRLSDGSMLSPDASLMRLERWQALNGEERRGFAPLCPDLVVELARPRDEDQRGVSELRRKMQTDQDNVARLGWLLLPHEHAVEVGPAAGEPQPIAQA